jgi:hypothetical protein
MPGQILNDEEFARYLELARSCEDEDEDAELLSLEGQFKAGLVDSKAARVFEQVRPDGEVKDWVRDCLQMLNERKYSGTQVEGIFGEDIYADELKYYRDKENEAAYGWR